YPLSRADRVLQSAGAGFDFSLWELFAPLAFGAGVVLPAAEEPRDLAALIGLIRRRQVTVVHFVPSVLAAFLDQEEVKRCESVRLVFSGGEALSSALAERVLARLGARLINQYGPTEASIDATFHRCRPGEVAAATAAIGRPIANTVVRVLDSALQPVPCGVAGELCLGGVGLARSYLERPALTAEVFIPDPFAGEAGARLYRTGDLVRYLPAGELEFLGRIDRQVKVRGFRIELGEIEAVLARHPDVREAAVIARDDGPRGPRLVAWVAGDAADRELRVFLGRHLPEYMVPASFLGRESLPRTAAGKVDRRALAALPESDLPAAERVAAP
ncbi:MAG: amino acid adenylation domain-containing protein, partial [FCB group bacterium]|nr:amino acid adenylation domain-containing protein [FCB group bacterium]